MTESECDCSAGWEDIDSRARWEFFDLDKKNWIPSENLGTVFDDARLYGGGRYRCVFTRVLTKEWMVEDERN